MRSISETVEGTAPEKTALVAAINVHSHAVAAIGTTLSAPSSFINCAMR
jgi:hypothetical protein